MYDLFDYENKNKFDDLQKTFFNSLAHKAIHFNIFFKNKTASLKHIDGGFFIKSTKANEYLLYTYDTTIGDKSSSNNLKYKFLEIKADVSTCLKNIESLYLKNLHNNVNFIFKKHYYILGIDFEDEKERNEFFKSSIWNKSESEKAERLEFFIKHCEKVQKLKQEIKENDPEHFGIFDARIKLFKTDLNDDKLFSFILKEIEI